MLTNRKSVNWGYSSTMEHYAAVKKDEETLYILM